MGVVAIKKHGLKLSSIFSSFLLGCMLLILLGVPFLAQTAKADVQKRKVLKTYPDTTLFDRVPLYFIENHGQFDSRVAYYVQGRDKTLYFTSQGIIFILRGERERRAPPEIGVFRASWTDDNFSPIMRANFRLSRWVVRLDFVGASLESKLLGRGLTSAKFSYLKGKPERWKTRLRSYRSLIYQDLWPGIDLVYTGTVNRLKYQFVVKPGANPHQIRLAYQGANVMLTDAGSLLIKAGASSFSDDVPVAYQDVGRSRKEVDCSYGLYNIRRDGTNEYGFRVGQYDSSKTLIIDPAIFIYCGYVGGSNIEEASDIAVDSSGNAYITGWTYSNEGTFPVLTGPDTTYNGDTDAFVAKIKADGSGLVYCGYIGGSSWDYGEGIAVDAIGNAFITGYTGSNQSSFPVLIGPDTSHNGGPADNDAFVAKVKADGTGLVYCGYIGGSDHDTAYDIAVDSAGNAYVTGFTWSNQSTNNFPVIAGPDTTHNGGVDAFVAKVKADGSDLAYCGYVGGNADEEGKGIAVDAIGNAFITGFTGSNQSSFPTNIGPDTTFNGGDSDVFVAKIKADGSTLEYCGYIGGTISDFGEGIALDSYGNAYVTGWTFSNELAENFPAVVGPDTSFNFFGDAFVAKVKADGSALDYCGYIGGWDYDYGIDIAVDATGSAYVTGYTQADETSEHFPVKGGPDDTFNGGNSDAFVAKVKADGTDLVYCGYVGGHSDEETTGIAVDVKGNAYISGWTYSDQSTFPVKKGPSISYSGSTKDAFVARISVKTPSAFVPAVNLLILDP
jgi:hypothetical protein